MVMAKRTAGCRHGILVHAAARKMTPKSSRPINTIQRNAGDGA
jgi:hypothetical protein